VGGTCSPDFPKSPITAGTRKTHYRLKRRKQATSSAWKSRGKKRGGDGSWPSHQRRRSAPQGLEYSKSCKHSDAPRNGKCPRASPGACAPEKHPETLKKIRPSAVGFFLKKNFRILFCKILPRKIFPILFLKWDKRIGTNNRSSFSIQYSVLLLVEYGSHEQK
jgi:hypothetical protein